MNFKTIMKCLSEGIILFLAPAAILTTINYAVKIPYIPFAISVLNMMTCGYIGYLISKSFSKSTISHITTMVIVLITSRAVNLVEGTIVLKIGDILTTLVMAVLTVYLVRFIERLVKGYQLFIVLPVSIIVLVPIGQFVFKGFSYLTKGITTVIQTFIVLQPFWMGGLLALSFGLLITSPFSSVAIANILALQGVAAGTASIGVITIGFCLCFAAWKYNEIPKSISVLIGSPKIMMLNVWGKPKLLIPFGVVMFILGGLFGILGMQNSTQGAGFGAVGFVGIVDYYTHNSSYSPWILTLLVLLVPILVSGITVLLGYKLGYFTEEDFKIQVDLK